MNDSRDNTPLAQRGDSDFQAVVLAAGKGSRMGTAGNGTPKVLLPLCGRPILTHVLASLAKAGIKHLVIVVSKNTEQPVRKLLGDEYLLVLQEEQLGSGHAVTCARGAAEGSRHLVVMCGDSPLFRPETIAALMDVHKAEGAAVSLTSAVLDDPCGYGRILRSASGEVIGIAEEKVATDEQKAIREINGGCYAFDAGWLWENIGSMSRNEAGEYCLTDMVDTAISQGRRVITVTAQPDEVAGVNTPDQLLQAEEILKARSACSDA